METFVDFMIAASSPESTQSLIEWLTEKISDGRGAPRYVLFFPPLFLLAGYLWLRYFNPDDDPLDRKLDREIHRRRKSDLDRWINEQSAGEQAQVATKLLGDLEQTIPICEQAGTRLSRAGMPLYNEHRTGRPTGYELARRQLLEQAERGHSFIRKMTKYRTDRTSPQIIAVHDTLEQVKTCCIHCSKINAERIANGRAFRCLLRELDNADRPTHRFTIDPADPGKIYESGTE